MDIAGVSLSGRNLYAIIRGIFSRGVTGNLSEPRNQGTLFQDSAGTTPISAVEQGIGLELDTSQGMALGADVCVNGAFATDTVWAKGAGVTIAGGVGVFTAVSSGVGLSQTIAGINAGETYKIEFDVSGFSAGGISVRLTSGSFIATGTANGHHTVYVVAGGGILQLYGTLGSNTLNIDNVAVRKIAGNHLIQATGAAEPVWKQDSNGKYYEYYDGVDNNFTCATGGGSSTAFSLQMAIMLEGAAAAQTLFSDAGANIGLKIERDASNQIVFSGGNGAAFVPATSAALTVGTAYVITCTYDGTTLSIQINNGTPVTAACALSAGTAGFTVGKENGASSKYFLGRRYGMIYAGKNYLMSDAEKLAGKQLLAAKAGISL